MSNLDEQDDIFFLAFAPDTTLATGNRMQQFAGPKRSIEEQNFYLQR